jgi:hypothetical protein
MLCGDSIQDEPEVGIWALKFLTFQSIDYNFSNIMLKFPNPF